MDSSTPLLGAIEAGGTKYVCAIARDGDHREAKLLNESRFPTREPAETLAEAVEFFRKASAEYGPIASLGIGTFGPARINRDAEDYGSILTTPKPGWAGYNVVEHLRADLGSELPIAFETDVNAAALGEAVAGAAVGLSYVGYITIGTGIGAGFLVNGEPLHGYLHPEVGHILMPDYDSEFGKDTNVCPFHVSCLEGRGSGPSIETRWGKPGHELESEHPAWKLEARYLAAGCVTLTACWSPERIIIGGGVSQQDGLIEKIRSEFETLAGGYWSLPPLNDYLVRPKLDQHAGIVGGLELASRQLH
ncbi:MAG: ROK family protein [Verrucomicrobiota bacterium]